MPKWLRGMIAPTLMLWFYMLATAATTVAHPDSFPPHRVDMLGRVAFSTIIAWWVMADARKRDHRLCYDYDSFVFFAWPLVVPVYLFRTRGLRAFLTLLCFAGIWIAAVLAASLFMAW